MCGGERRRELRSHTQVSFINVFRKAHYILYCLDTDLVNVGHCEGAERAMCRHLNLDGLTLCGGAERREGQGERAQGVLKAAE